MADLPAPSPRRLLHERRVVTRGYLREDGLFDIDGEIVDEKTYTYADRARGPLPAGMPMHHMRARLTVDTELVIRAASAAMPGRPFETCLGAVDPVEALVGASLAKGLRKALDEAMGRTKGCTHLRDLLLAMATTAFQTISCYREQFMPEIGAPKLADGATPFFFDQCRSWDATGPVVAEYYPQFYRKP